MGKGTHWVCYYNKYYFDSFGLKPTQEIIKYIPEIKYNNIQYQDKNSVLCGYYCLFFLKKMQKGHKIYDILYKMLNPLNQQENENTIANYFM